MVGACLQLVEDPVCKEGNSRGLPASTGRQLCVGGAGGMITAYLLPCEAALVSVPPAEQDIQGVLEVIGACIASLRLPEPFL